MVNTILLHIWVKLRDAMSGGQESSIVRAIVRRVAVHGSHEKKLLILPWYVHVRNKNLAKRQEGKYRSTWGGAHEKDYSRGWEW